MLKKVLIANRGEITVRIIRACQELGIETVTVHSEADEDSLHVRFSDQSVCIGPPQSQHSYLNGKEIISACLVTNCEAVHPGYGFLSESEIFAETMINHGINFIGPPPKVIELLGNKVKSREKAVEVGLPVPLGSEIIEKASIPFWLKPIEMVKNSENPLVAISIFVYFVLIVRYLKKKK